MALSPSFPTTRHRPQGKHPVNCNDRTHQKHPLTTRQTPPNTPRPPALYQTPLTPPRGYFQNPANKQESYDPMTNKPQNSQPTHRTYPITPPHNTSNR